MGLETLTDEKIFDLLQIRKRVTNPGIRQKEQGKHTQRDWKAVDDETGDLNFSLFTRQHLHLENDFSTGLIWHMPSGETVTLCRYNGPSHRHRNTIEGKQIDYICHIHKASERYIRAGKKPEIFAEETDRYHSLKGALYCLLLDCNIHGVQSIPDEPRLL